MTFEKELNYLPDNFSILINSSRDSYHHSYNILKNLPEKGICISLIKSADYLKQELENKGIKTDNFHFIDTVSKLIDEKNFLTNCTYLNAPQDLNELKIEINNTIKKIKGKNTFLILDSLSGLLMYHPSEQVVDFLNSLMKKLRSLKIKTIILANEEIIRDKIRKKLLCDRIYSLE